MDLLNQSGVKAGPIVGSGLTLPAGSLAGNSTGATAGIEAVTVGTGLSLSAGVLTATGGGGTGTGFDGVVTAYSDLPVDGTAALNAIYLVRTSTGVWFVSRKQRGMWQRVNTTGTRATDWQYMGEWLEEFSDANIGIYNDSDNTKVAAFDASGITTGTKRTFVFPNKNGTLAVAGDYGTAATRDVASSGNASTSQVVKGDDTRLSDARTPTAHTQAASTISDASTVGKAVLTATTNPLQQVAMGVREVLTADRTYYVRTDGSDSNTGLSNTAGAAFLTIQKAIDIISATLDIAIYTVTVQVADGTYTTPVVLKACIGSGTLIINGNATTPANVSIACSTSDCFISGYSYSANSLLPTSPWTLKNMKVSTSAGGYYGVKTLLGPITLINMNFGSCNGGHIACYQGGQIFLSGAYTISGGATYHIDCAGVAYLNCSGMTVTLSGTPAFSQVYIKAANTATARMANVTFSGSATGTRYLADRNGVIDIGGQTPNTYVPGNANGSTTNGGTAA